MTYIRKRDGGSCGAPELDFGCGCGNYAKKPDAGCGCAGSDGRKRRRRSTKRKSRSRRRSSKRKSRSSRRRRN